MIALLFVVQLSITLAVLGWYGLAQFRRRFVIVPRARFLAVEMVDGEGLFLAIPAGLDTQDTATLTRLVDELVKGAA